MFDGKFDLSNLMQNAKKMQEVMAKAQDELAKIEIHGESGAGMVQVTIDAQHNVKQLIIADELLKENKTVITDLIIAALNNAHQKVVSVAQQKMMEAGSGLLKNKPE